MDIEKNQPSPQELQDKITALSRMLIKSFSYAEADPDTFLLNARKTAETICKFIYNKEIGDDSSKKLMLNDLGRALVNRKIIPERIGILIGTIQTYGNYGAHAQDDFSETSREWITPCQTALANLSNWFFLEYLKGQIPSELNMPLKEYTDSEIISEIPPSPSGKKRNVFLLTLLLSILGLVAVFYFTRDKKTNASQPPLLDNSQVTQTTAAPVSPAVSDMETVNMAKSPNALRIAILYFDSGDGDTKYQGLSKGLADMLISDLSKFNMLQVVEREKLEEILKEQNLSNSKRFDEATAVKIGKLLGVQYIMVGSYFEMLGNFRVDARIIEVETGKIFRSEGVTSSAEKFFDLEKELAGKIISGLSVAMKTGEEEYLKSKPSDKMTASAGLQYSKALDLMDQGKTDKAKEQFALVLKDNPDFEPAHKALQRLKR
jgi:TolB-like protein